MNGTKSERVRKREKRMLVWMIREALREGGVYTYSLDHVSLI